jgi:hypothetical protein
MSKLLLNRLVQISKVCQKSEFQIKFKKVLFLELGQAPVFGHATAHFLFFPPTGPLSLSPLGLGLSASPAYPLGPGGHKSVAPYPLAASLMGKRLTSDHHRPSPRPADKWTPSVITFLQLCLSPAAPPPLSTTSGRSSRHSAPRDAASVPLLHPPPSIPP